MPDIELPGDVLVNPPPTPAVLITPPPAPGVAVAPVQGPVGPQGPPGQPLDTLAYVYSTSIPAAVHQIHHGLPYKPAGIVCQDADGVTVIGWLVTHPAAGITEITFGSDITPIIYLS